MEYLDVLDKNGKKTGVKKLRSEIHRNGDWHQCVHVWIVNSKGELLLQKRANNKETNPGKWDISSACHVVAGEDLATAAVRETKEELGVDILREDLSHLISYKYQSTHNDDTYINNGFFETFVVFKNIPVQDIKFQKEEISAVKYMLFRKLKKKIADKNPEYLNHPKELPALFSFLARYKGTLPN